MTEQKIDIPLGTLENKDETDSEADEPQPKIEQPVVDPVRLPFCLFVDFLTLLFEQTQLQWIPWALYYAKKGYEACDAAGEKLAWFFGITKPKYHAELEEYERMDEEVEFEFCD